MSIPNGVPQSPMWFWRMTVWPRHSSNARERIADHRAAEMTDVHLLRDVRVRVVDHDALGRIRERNAETVTRGERRPRRSRAIRRAA